jgi:hypothetical protein
MARELTEFNGILCWCDVEHVSSLTGVTVTDDNMSQAQGIINSETGVYPEALPEDLKAMDKIRLTDALAYEAAWVAGKIDLFAESTVKNVSQDGVQADYPSELSQYLAPLALVCLKRLSWNRAGAVFKRPGGKYPDADAARDAVLRGEAVDTSGYGGIVPGRPFS